MSAEALERLLAEYKREWESGDNRSLIHAFLLCADNGLPFPHWLRKSVLGELEHCYTTRRRGKAMTRTAEKQDVHAALHSTRHGLVANSLKIQALEVSAGMRKRINKREAARDAFESINPGKEASLREVEQILESYGLIERQGNNLK